MTDKRLAESIAHIPHGVWLALEDGTIDNAEFARALADSPSVTSLLADAAVGKAVRGLESTGLGIVIDAMRQRARAVDAEAALALLFAESSTAIAAAMDRADAAEAASHLGEVTATALSSGYEADYTNGVGVLHLGDDKSLRALIAAYWSYAKRVAS